LKKKKIFSITSRPISIKDIANHRRVMGILNFSNKGPDPLQRGDNQKMGWGNLKILSRAIEPKELIFT
jgi:hypothetical protein